MVSNLYFLPTTLQQQQSIITCLFVRQHKIYIKLTYGPGATSITKSVH